MRHREAEVNERTGSANQGNSPCSFFPSTSCPPHSLRQAQDRGLGYKERLENVCPVGLQPLLLLTLLW